MVAITIVQAKHIEAAATTKELRNIAQEGKASLCAAMYTSCCFVA